MCAAASVIKLQVDAAGRGEKTKRPSGRRGRRADLVIASYSAAAAPASKEKRIRALSEASPPTAKFPVLRFLGICNGGARVLRMLRPRSSSSPSRCCSAPARVESGCQSSSYSTSREAVG